MPCPFLSAFEEFHQICLTKPILCNSVLAINQLVPILTETFKHFQKDSKGLVDLIVPPTFR